MKSRIEAFVIQQIVKENKTFTKYTLAEAAPCHYKAALIILKRLNKTNPRIRIIRWVRPNNRYIPLYGHGKYDAKKPAPLTSQQRQQRRRRKEEIRNKELRAKREKRARDRALTAAQHSTWVIIP